MPSRLPLTLAEMITLAIAEAIVERRPYTALRYSTGEPAAAGMARGL